MEGGESSLTAGDSYYYVFNLGDDKGFVIVSGDDRTAPILGYSDHGTFDMEAIPDNMRSFLQFYADEIRALDEGTTATNDMQEEASYAMRRQAPAKAQGTVRTRHFVAPLVTSRWNQGDPYNLTCPDYYKSDGTKGRPASGCTATAIAQVMYYYRYPSETKSSIPSLTNTYKVTSATGTTTNKTVTARSVPRGTPLDWDHMRDRYEGGETEEERLAVANLMLYCGQMVQMDYGSSSSANPSMASTGLYKYFGYDDGCYVADRGDYKLDDWIQLLYTELSTGHPLIYTGVSSGGAHAFVVDGFDGDNLFHVNWGWGGSSDGWFLITVMNPGDNTGIGASSSSDGYSMGQYILAGLGLPDDEKALPHKCMTITDVKVSGSSVSANYINWTGTSNNFNVCLMVADDETGELRMVSGTQQSLGQFDVNVYKNISISLNKRLKEGTYRITPASRYVGNAKWYPLYDMEDNYIEAVVDASGTPRLSLVSAVEDIRVDEFAFPGNRVKDKEQEVKVTFTNLGDEYNHELHLLASRTSAKKATGSRAPLMLRKGETGSISFYFTPTEAGTYNLWLCRDANGSNPVAQTTVDIYNTNQAPKDQLRLATVSLQNTVNSTVVSNRLKGSAAIRNMKSTPFDGKVRLQLWEQGDNNSGVYYSSQSTVVPLQIGGGKTVSVSFDFQNLKYDRYYYLVANYIGQDGNLDNGGLWLDDHRYKPTHGILYWRSNGAMAAAENKPVFTTPSTACGVYLDQTNVRTMRTVGNPNAIYVLSEGSDMPSVVGPRCNMVAGLQADSILLDTEHPFFVPVEFSARTAILSHTFPSDTQGSGWQALTLPFRAETVRIDGEEFPLNADTNHFWIYEFAAVDDGGEAIFEPVTELRANTPYIIAADATLAGRTLVFEGRDAVFSQTDLCRYIVSSPTLTMYGSPLQTTKVGIYVLNEEGTAFVWSEEQQEVAPLSGWFTTTLGEGERPDLLPLPAVPQSTDALPTLVASPAAQPQPVYDLSGRRVGTLNAGEDIGRLNLRHGMYIVGGKKVMR